MSRALTTREIRIEAQREDMSSADCTKLRQKILSHRAGLKSRRDEITRELRKEPERIIDLNREDEQIEVDLGVLYDCENALYKLVEMAADREAEDAVREVLGVLPGALERLQLANVEQEAARVAIESLLSSLAGNRERLRRMQQLTSAHGITEAQVEELVRATCYPPRFFTEDTVKYAHARLRRDMGS
jgi:hypothetical protein